MQEERYQHLVRETNDMAEQIVSSGQLKGHAGTVRLRRDVQNDFYRKHWTTTCFVASGRITLVHVGTKDGATENAQPLDLAADELDSTLAMKYPVFSEGWMANFKRNWWAYKHQMRHICQRNYYQDRKAEQKRSHEHKKDDNAQDTHTLDVSSWPGRWAVLHLAEQ